MSDIKTEVLAAATAAKKASVTLRQTSRASKDAAINAIADALVAHAEEIVAANELDVSAARAAETSDAIVDRLTLDTQRISDIAQAARSVASLADPVGESVREWDLPNGLHINQVRVPLGVVAMIYEARPNVTVDAAVLCLKSGNAALLRGSGSAYNTNLALVKVMRDALAGSGMESDCIVLVPGTSHESVDVVMKARGLVDVIIPRGGASLINSVVNGSVVPVIETGVGNCHLFIDKAADIAKAVKIAVNSKTQRVSVCNALETLLVDESIASQFLPALLAEYKNHDVTIHGSNNVRSYCDAAKIPFVEATDKDWADEYYSLDIALDVVKDIDAAIAHIHQWSTGHTEAIVTEDQSAAEKFISSIDSAAVIVNASTRFTDGGEFGFGAEIGISTQKLHARGPMGLAELTSTKYVVTGDGQIRS